MKNQKTAVCDLLLETLANNGIVYELGTDKPIAEYLTKTDIESVRAQIVDMFNNDEISMTDAGRAKYYRQPEMKGYVSGLVNNWIRKNKYFNTMREYATHPDRVGTRTGQGDAQIKSLRALKKKYASNPQVVVEIEEAIATRLAEIKPNTIEIQVEHLPEQFKYLLD